MVEKVHSKLQGWKNLLLSSEGKETLIKSLVLTIPAYFLACVFSPWKVCLTIDNLNRQFWWGGSTSKRLLCWKNWKWMCLPKKIKGLGFWNLKQFNSALLMKQGWRLLQDNNSFWARLIKSIYFPDSSFLLAKKGLRRSWMWSNFLEGRDLLLKDLHW